MAKRAKPVKPAKPTENKISFSEQAIQYYYSNGRVETEFLNFLRKSTYDTSFHSKEEWKDILKFNFPREKCIFVGGVGKETSGKNGAKYLGHSIKINGKPGTLLAHRMAALVRLDHDKEFSDLRIENNVLLPEKILASKWQASHWYCHNDACINPMHLLPECNRVNQERNHCKMWNDQLINEIGYRLHVTPKYGCTHVPTCVTLQSSYGIRIIPRKWENSAYQNDQQLIEYITEINKYNLGLFFTKEMEMSIKSRWNTFLISVGISVEEFGKESEEEFQDKTKWSCDDDKFESKPVKKKEDQ